MLKLRQLGMAPSVSRPIAEKVAPSVLFQAVMIGVVIAPLDLGAVTDSAAHAFNFAKIARTIAGGDTLFRYGISVNDTFELIEESEDIIFDPENEITSIINFYTMARIIIREAGRALFTIINPA